MRLGLGNLNPLRQRGGADERLWGGGGGGLGGLGALFFGDGRVMKGGIPLATPAGRRSRGRRVGRQMGGRRFRARLFDLGNRTCG